MQQLRLANRRWGSGCSRRCCPRLRYQFLRHSRHLRSRTERGTFGQSAQGPSPSSDHRDEVRYKAGRSEVLLGKALKGRRHQAIIATKFGIKLGEAEVGADPSYIRKSLDDRLMA